jgi:hypothetical protein
MQNSRTLGESKSVMNPGFHRIAMALTIAAGGHTATLLANVKVPIAGGADQDQWSQNLWRQLCTAKNSSGR